MRVLLDTHALIWYVDQDQLLRLVRADAVFDQYGVKRIWDLST